MGTVLVLVSGHAPGAEGFRSGPGASGRLRRWSRLASCWPPAVPVLGRSHDDRVNWAGVVQVVAAENFWGSIASQIGGATSQVASIITNPNTDPHSYEPTAGDARTLAAAQLVIENGIGYDPWVPKLLAADQGHPTVLDVGDAARRRRRGQPAPLVQPGRRADRHRRRWSTDFAGSTRPTAPTSRAQRAHFDTVALRPYDAAIAAIRAKYAGTPVGASESIFAMLAPALGLNLITPYSFLKAISEGTDVSAADKADDRQPDQRPPDQDLRLQQPERHPRRAGPAGGGEGRAHPARHDHRDAGPADATYQAWQTRQLLGIEAALASGERALTRDPGRWRPRMRRRPDSGRPAGGDRRLTRPCASAPGRSRFDDAPRCAWAAATIWSDVTLRRRAGRVRGRARPERRREVDPGQGGARARRRCRPARRRVLGRAPGHAGRDIGYLPQRRSFDPGLRVRGIDVVRLGSDGERWGVPLPGESGCSAARRAAGSASTRSSSWSARPRSRTARSGRSPAASSSAC